MIQQVTNTRTDKQLMLNDIRNISFASCLNFFHTNTMFNPWLFGIWYIAHFYYVKRLSSDSYQYQKTVGGTCNGTSKILNKRVNVNGSSINDMITHLYATTTLTQAQVEAMHPDLVCQNDGEERVLIDCVYRRASGFNKRKLGFFIMNPPNAKAADNSTDNVCVYPLVITPKPGLFPVKT